MCKPAQEFLRKSTLVSTAKPVRVSPPLARKPDLLAGCLVLQAVVQRLRNLVN